MDDYSLFAIPLYRAQKKKYFILVRIIVISDVRCWITIFLSWNLSNYQGEDIVESSNWHTVAERFHLFNCLRDV